MDSEMVSGETGNRKQEPAAQERWDQVPRSQKALATGAKSPKKRGWNEAQRRRQDWVEARRWTTNIWREVSYKHDNSGNREQEYRMWGMQ
jgi:hypothetical protein